MGQKSPKLISRDPEREIKYEPESRQSSVESWKARYDEMLDIVLMETQEEKDAAMAKIEVGKNSYVDSLRNKSSGFGLGFGGTMESSASRVMEYTIPGTMGAASGLGNIEEKQDEEVRVVVKRPRRKRKSRKDDHLKDSRLAIPRAEEAMISALGSLGDVIGQVLSVVWCSLFSPRFHLVLEVFTAVAVAVLVWLGGDELPFTLVVLGIGLAVHGVLSLK